MNSIYPKKVVYITSLLYRFMIKSVNILNIFCCYTIPINKTQSDIINYI